MNKIILSGRLTADPELRRTENGVSLCRFSVAVRRKSSRDITDFINIVAWRQTAEFVVRYFKKGKPILIVGELQLSSWTGKDGARRTSAEVMADDAEFCGDSAESSVSASESPPMATHPAQEVQRAHSGGAATQAPSGWEAVRNDEKLPF